MSGRKGKWGDEEDDEMPEPVETQVDAKGFKTRTEYKVNDRKQKVKITSKIRVIEEVQRTTVEVAPRLARLQKFGNAQGVKDESNVTIQDMNEVLMLSPKDSEAEDNGQSSESVNKAFESFQKKQQWRALQRKYELGKRQARKRKSLCPPPVVASVGPREAWRRWTRRAAAQGASTCHRRCAAQEALPWAPRSPQ